MVYHSLFAYLDAGTGSIIVQAVIGAVAGVTVFGRRFIGSAVHRVRSLFGKSEQVDTAQSAKEAGK